MQFLYSREIVQVQQRAVIQLIFVQEKMTPIVLTLMECG